MTKIIRYFILKQKWNIKRAQFLLAQQIQCIRRFCLFYFCLLDIRSMLTSHLNDAWNIRYENQTIELQEVQVLLFNVNYKMNQWLIGIQTFKMSHYTVHILSRLHQVCKQSCDGNWLKSKSTQIHSTSDWTSCSCQFGNNHCITEYIYI